MKRIAALSLVLIFILSGCSSFKSVSLGYDILEDTSNLDPQFATDTTAKLIITNIFEGLVIDDSRKNIYPGVAEKWDISPDKLTYTFYLREDAFWNRGKDEEKAPVTAHDFEFGLSRLFGPGAVSPYVDDFSSIKNAKSIIKGEKKLSELGVEAVSQYELIIELDEKDDFFIEKLASTAAMPCSKEFFQQTGGRYGLERTLIKSNGPFYMSYWETDHRITLKTSPEYKGRSSVNISSIDLYINRDDSKSRFLDSKTDILFTDDSQLAYSLRDDEWKVSSYEGTLWAMRFDLSDPEWSAVPLRQSLAYFLDYKEMSDLFSLLHKDKDFGSRYSFSPRIFTSENMYLGNPILGASSPKYTVGNNPVYGSQLKQEAMDALDVGRTTISTVYYPSEGIHGDILTALQKVWKQYGITIVFTGLSHDEYKSFVSGEFKMGMVPIKITSSSGEKLLEEFTTTARTAGIKYNNPNYDRLLEKVKRTNDYEGKLDYILKAERLLLTDAVLIPFYTEKNYYVVSDDAKDIDVYPADGLIRFHSAKDII